MGQHEEDGGIVCEKCGVTFDCHEVLSPNCPSEEQGYPAGCAKCAELETELGRACFAMRIGYPLPEELIAARAALAREQERSKALAEALRDMTFDEDGTPTCWPTQERVMALLEQTK